MGLARSSRATSARLAPNSNISAAEFAGLVGLALGWSSWAAIPTGFLLGWSGTAIGALLARLTGNRHPSRSVPLAPFLLAGTVLALDPLLPSPPL